jgi:hypothetical protein
MEENTKLGTCDLCNVVFSVPLNKKYYIYDIECTCCTQDEHVETVDHCNDCEPKPPSKVVCTVEPIPESEL